MSISRGNVPFLDRFPRLIDTFLLMAEDFLLTKLQVGTPVEYEKQLEQLLQLVTTLSISHAQNRARSGYAMARKGTMKWNLHASRVTILLHGKQQNTTLRLGHSCRLSLRSVVHSCFPCSNLWSTRASKRRCPREALFKVVKVVQVVFPTQQAVLKTTQTSLSLKYRMNLPNL